MKLSKSTLKKMKKDELIELILELQNKTAGTIYETLKSRSDAIVVYHEPFTDVFGNKKKRRIKWALKPGDYLIISEEIITPSGYPESGTYQQLFGFKLEKLNQKDYKKLREIGWNKEGIEFLKEKLKLNI